MIRLVSKYISLLYCFQHLHSLPRLIGILREGLKRLKNSEAKENFWKLTRFYESQIRITSCGIASAAIALNVLGVEAPPSKYLGEHRLFTQEEFFTNEVKEQLAESTVLQRGIFYLKNFQKCYKCFPFT